MVLNRETFAQRVTELSDLIDAELLRLVSSGEQIPNLHDGVLYSMGLDVEDRKIRGKRLRPVLCLLAAESLGSDPEHAMPFASAIELLHNFALVHDDIEDGDVQRRGRPCTYIKYGLAHGINIGDYMLSKVYSVLCQDQRNPLDVRERLLDLMHRTHEHIFIGQSLDISARASRNFSRADYQYIVAMKTGSYLAAPIVGGAITANASAEILQAIRSYGNAIGPLFQVKDDIIDLTTGKGRGIIGSDIREGKRSFLVAVAQEKCNPADRERLYNILDLPREDTTERDVAWSIELFDKTGAIAVAEEYCEVLRQRADDALRPLPDRLRACLEIAADLMSNRTT